jgi:hypothetical protein
LLRWSICHSSHPLLLLYSYAKFISASRFHFSGEIQFVFTVFLLRQWLRMLRLSVRTFRQWFRTLRLSARKLRRCSRRLRLSARMFRQSISQLRPSFRILRLSARTFRRSVRTFRLSIRMIRRSTSLSCFRNFFIRNFNDQTPLHPYEANRNAGGSHRRTLPYSSVILQAVPLPTYHLLSAAALACGQALHTAIS